MPKQYKIVDGTSYDVRTPDEVVRILEDFRRTNSILHISLGDTKTGKDWLEENDVIGRIGRSMGNVKVPLLIESRGSTGGPAILDHCIVRIRSKGIVLYQHPTYHTGALRIQTNANRVEILCDGKVHASFDSHAKATQWLKRFGLSTVVPV